MANPLETTKIHHEEAATERATFGFWVYLMTDLLMFAVLFAVYAVLVNSTAGGPSGREIFSLPLALTETLLLLTSSFTCGLAMIAVHQRNRKQTFVWFGITYVLGIVFLVLELMEFSKLIHEGHSAASSAFMSSFFALVGAHGLHIVVGLLWMLIVMGFLLTRGFTNSMTRKLTMFSMYWHFLDIVWIFIFTIVYLRAFL